MKQNRKWLAVFLALLMTVGNLITPVSSAGAAAQTARSYQWSFEDGTPDPFILVTGDIGAMPVISKWDYDRNQRAATAELQAAYKNNKDGTYYISTLMEEQAWQNKPAGGSYNEKFQGTLRSPNISLASSTITFKLSGGKDNYLRVMAADGTELARANAPGTFAPEGQKNTTGNIFKDISLQIPSGSYSDGMEVYIEVVDCTTAAYGYIQLDDVRFSAYAVTQTAVDYQWSFEDKTAEPFRLVDGDITSYPAISMWDYDRNTKSGTDEEKRIYDINKDGIYYLSTLMEPMEGQNTPKGGATYNEQFTGVLRSPKISLASDTITFKLSGNTKNYFRVVAADGTELAKANAPGVFVPEGQTRETGCIFKDMSLKIPSGTYKDGMEVYLELVDCTVPSEKYAFVQLDDVRFRGYATSSDVSKTTWSFESGTPEPFTLVDGDISGLPVVSKWNYDRNVSGDAYDDEVRKLYSMNKDGTYYLSTLMEPLANQNTNKAGNTFDESFTGVLRSPKIKLASNTITFKLSGGTDNYFRIVTTDGTELAKVTGPGIWKPEGGPRDTGNIFIDMSMTVPADKYQDGMEVYLELADTMSKGPYGFIQLDAVSFMGYVEEQPKTDSYYTVKGAYALNEGSATEGTLTAEVSLKGISAVAGTFGLQYDPKIMTLKPNGISYLNGTKASGVNLPSGNNYKIVGWISSDASGQPPIDATGASVAILSFSFDMSKAEFDRMMSNESLGVYAYDGGDASIWDNGGYIIDKGTGYAYAANTAVSYPNMDRYATVVTAEAGASVTLEGITQTANRLGTVTQALRNGEVKYTASKPGFKTAKGSFLAYNGAPQLIKMSEGVDTTDTNWSFEDGTPSPFTLVGGDLTGKPVISKWDYDRNRRKDTDEIKTIYTMNKDGTYYLSTLMEPMDKQNTADADDKSVDETFTGTLRSPVVNLASDTVTFKLSGNKDNYFRIVAEDGTELARAAGPDGHYKPEGGTETATNPLKDMSLKIPAESYTNGMKVYFELVDVKTRGPYGYIQLDAVKFKSYDSDPSEFAEISEAKVGLIAPQAEAEPKTAETESAQFTVTSTEWQDESGKTLAAGETFGYSTVYKAIVTLTADSGYTFTSGTAIMGIKNGTVQNKTVEGDGAGNVLRFEILYSATGDKPAAVIASAPVSLTAPLGGAAPSTAKTAAAAFTVADTQWTTALESEPVGETFGYNTAYKAAVTLKAKEGYIFNEATEITGIKKELISDVEITGNGDANTLSFVVTYPATGDEPSPESEAITEAAVTIEAPAAGAVKQNAASDSTAFTVTGTDWTDSNGYPVESRFDYETVYTASVTLRTASGYLFNADTKVTGVTAKNLQIIGGGTALTFDVTFSATEKNPGRDQAKAKANEALAALEAFQDKSAIPDDTEKAKVNKKIADAEAAVNAYLQWNGAGTSDLTGYDYLAGAKSAVAAYEADQMDINAAKTAAETALAALSAYQTAESIKNDMGKVTVEGLVAVAEAKIAAYESKGGDSKGLAGLAYLQGAKDALDAYEAAKGTTVSGIVSSYNPKVETTVHLLQGGTVVYTTTIAAIDDMGQAEQEFSFDKVAKGTYTLLITKPGHTSYTLEELEIGAEPLDLSTSTDDQIAVCRLYVGDYNDDGLVTGEDLNILWGADNYGLAIDGEGAAANRYTDINGDGLVTGEDLNILWSADNYGMEKLVIRYTK